METHPTAEQRSCTRTTNSGCECTPDNLTLTKARCLYGESEEADRDLDFSKFPSNLRGAADRYGGSDEITGIREAMGERSAGLRIRALQLLLIIPLFSSACAFKIFQPTANRLRNEIVDSLQTHYCAGYDWPNSMADLFRSRNLSQQQRDALSGAERAHLVDMGLDTFVVLQDTSQQEIQLVTLLRRPSCNRYENGMDLSKTTTWVSFEIPRQFATLGHIESSGTDTNNSAARSRKKLFEAPDKQTSIYAHLYEHEPLAPTRLQLDEGRRVIKRTLPAVFHNIEWIRDSSKLYRRIPRTILIFLADNTAARGAPEAGQRSVLATLTMRLGEQLFGIDARAPVSQQREIEKLVEGIESSVEFGGVTGQRGLCLSRHSLGEGG